MSDHFRVITFIVIALILRLAFTTQPPVEYEHTWRQATGLMYARNFVETDANFFHPRIDDNAGGSGILVLEAPVLYYGMYLLSVPFGYQNWYGRLINLMVSSLGLYFFFLLVRRFFTERIAYYGTLVLTTSLWLIFSRKTMQDTMAVSFMLMALQLNFNYFRDGRWLTLAGYMLLASLGMLAKIPVGMYLLFPLLYLFSHPTDEKRIFLWGVASLVPVVLTCLWYFGYAPYASEKYGYWHNVGEPFPDGLWSIFQNIDTVAERFFFQSMHSFVFLVLYVFGWIQMIRKKNWNYLILIGSFTLIFGLYMVRSGTYFVQHNYYMVPYVPLMALMIAWVLAHIPKRRLATGLLVIGMLEGIAWQARDFTNSPREEYKMKLTRIVNDYTSKDENIVLINDGNPVGFYFTHRKGWLQSDKNPLPNNKLISMSEKGAKILIVNRRERNQNYNLPVLYEDEDYRVYDLSEKSLSL